MGRFRWRAQVSVLLHIYMAAGSDWLPALRAGGSRADPWLLGPSSRRADAPWEARARAARVQTAGENLCREAARSGGSYVWNRLRHLGRISSAYPVPSFLPPSVARKPSCNIYLLPKYKDVTQSVTTLGCCSPMQHLPRGLVAPLGCTPSDTRIMDPQGPDAERGRGPARPLPFLAPTRPFPARSGLVKGASCRT